jgi:hypothetical protein
MNRQPEVTTLSVLRLRQVDKTKKNGLVSSISMFMPLCAVSVGCDETRLVCAGRHITVAWPLADCTL